MWLSGVESLAQTPIKSLFEGHEHLDRRFLVITLLGL